jgi:hypothetical protein
MSGQLVTVRNIAEGVSSTPGSGKNWATSITATTGREMILTERRAPSAERRAPNDPRTLCTPMITGR